MEGRTFRCAVSETFYSCHPDEGFRPRRDLRSAFSATLNRLRKTSRLLKCRRLKPAREPQLSRARPAQLKLRPFKTSPHVPVYDASLKARSTVRAPFLPALPSLPSWDCARPAAFDYHKDVKYLFCVLLVITVVLAGCNGGSHPPRIGSAAPDFTITDSEHTVSLSQFKGKLVLLNFWATWCPPCVAEMPDLVKLQKQMGDKVTIVAVSEDADDSAYKQFIRDHNISLLTVRDVKQSTNELYGSFKFPETYVIDRNGKIVRKFIGAADWTSPDIVDYLNKL